jgi:hypothetical protein
MVTSDWGSGLHGDLVAGGSRQLAESVRLRKELAKGLLDNVAVELAPQKRALDEAFAAVSDAAMDAEAEADLKGCPEDFTQAARLARRARFAQERFQEQASAAADNVIDGPARRLLDGVDQPMLEAAQRTVELDEERTVKRDARRAARRLQAAGDRTSVASIRPGGVESGGGSWKVALRDRSRGLTVEVERDSAGITLDAEGRFIRVNGALVKVGSRGANWRVVPYRR